MDAEMQGADMPQGQRDVFQDGTPAVPPLEARGTTPITFYTAVPSQSSSNLSSAKETRNFLQRFVDVGLLDAEDFRKHILRAPPPAAYAGLDAHQANIDLIRTSSTLEIIAYQPMADILSAISEQIWNERGSTPGSLIKFFLCPNSPPIGPAESERTKVDIGGFQVNGPADNIPSPSSWELFISFIKGKRSHGTVPWQALSYARNVVVACLSAAGQFYLGLDHHGFVIFAQNASFLIRTKTRYEWSEPEAIEALLDFVYNLYNPPDHFPLVDPLFHRNPDSDASGVIWNIVHQDMVNHSLRRVLSYPGPGRQTFVLRCQDDHTNTVLLKRVWRDPRRRFREEELYKIVQAAGGFIPSVAHFIGTIAEPTLEVGVWPVGCPFPDFGRPSTQIFRRERVVQLFDSIGVPLSECKSVLQLLKAVFDAVQGHRELLRRNVLHRDVSDNNILIQPKHGTTNPEGLPIVSIPSAYKTISQVLYGIDSTAIEGLLIDLDNAYDIRDTTPPGDGARTGTHKFIAKSVLAAKWHVPKKFYTLVKASMPQLEGQALQLYINAWGPTEYVRWITAVSGPQVIYSFNSLSTFTHMPYHDMESFFWVIFWALLRAVPDGATDPEDGSEHDEFASAYVKIAFHGRGRADDRDTVADGAECFHSGLRSVADMLTDMWYYVGLEWVYWYQDGNIPLHDHAHEAVMRLLLREIVKLEGGDGIPIKMGVRKPKTKTEADK